jgi:hypothetical protein
MAAGNLEHSEAQLVFLFVCFLSFFSQCQVQVSWDCAKQHQMMVLLREAMLQRSSCQSKPCAVGGEKSSVTSEELYMQTLPVKTVQHKSHHACSPSPEHLYADPLPL